jgi:hypothetical protein
MSSTPINSPFTTGTNPSRPSKQPIPNNTFDAFLQPGQVSNMAKLEAEKAARKNKLAAKFTRTVKDGKTEAKAGVSGLVRRLTLKKKKRDAWSITSPHSTFSLSHFSS